MQLNRECSYARALGPLSNFLSIENEAKNNLHFKYGSVSYEAFSKQCCIHSSQEQKKENLTGRETIKRAFRALYHAVYKIAQALFIDLVQAINSDRTILKIRFYYLVRDLQECFGHLVSLAFPQYGLYHIQASNFQSQCYTLFLNQKTSNNHEEVASREHRIVALAEEAFMTNDLDDALAIIDQSNVDAGAKRPLLVKIARSHFVNNNLDKAFNVIMNVPDCEAKEALIEEIAERHFYNGDPKKAFQVLQVIRKDHKDINESLSIKAAERHLVAGNMDAAFKVISNITFDEKTKDLLLGELAKYHHTKGGNYHTVLKVIWKISDYDIRDNVVAHLAEQYFAKDDLESAFELIKWLVKDKITKQTFILKLAEGHFSKDELDAALEVSREVYRLGPYGIKIDNVQSWEAFFLKLAERYFAKDNLKMSFRTINGINHHNAKKQAFLVKLFHRSYEQNNLSMASEVHSDISNFAIRYQFSIDLMIAYHKEGDANRPVSFAKYDVMTAILLEVDRQMSEKGSKERREIDDRVISLLESALTAYGYNQKIRKALISHDKATLTAVITALALDVTEKFNNISCKTESKEHSISLEPARIAASLSL